MSASSSQFSSSSAEESDHDYIFGQLHNTVLFYVVPGAYKNFYPNVGRSIDKSTELDVWLGVIGPGFPIRISINNIY